MHTPETMIWVGGDRDIVLRASVIGECMLFARRLINLPANYLDPESFVAESLKAMDGLDIQTEVWDRDRLERERCGSLLAVARGSVKPPRLLILKYAGTQATSSPQLLWLAKG